MQLGVVPYREVWDLQRSLAAAVSAGRRPRHGHLLRASARDHRRAPHRGGRAARPGGRRGRDVETDRGGKSTYHGPGQLVCYPILDLHRHGKDVKLYVRRLEQAIIARSRRSASRATRIEGLTGVWLESPPRKIASIGVHISRWITTHGYALNVDLDPAPFSELDHRLRARGCRLHHDRPRAGAAGDGRGGAPARRRGDGRGVRARARAATRSKDGGTGLWPQPIHDKLATK